jgi:hypothetical protein
MSRLAYTDRWHQYALDGKRVPSVTGITGALNKPALPVAAAKEAALWAARNVAGLDMMDTDAWVKAAAAAPREVWNARADDGRRLHKLAESVVLGEPMPDELDGAPVADHVRDMAEQLVRFFDAWDVQPLASEAMIFHEAYRYAGRFDLAAELKNAGRWLLDYKTGASGIYAETSLQLTAYGHATHYVTPDNEDRTMSELGIERAAAVWIRPDSWELVPVKYDVGVFAYFRHLGAVHEWTKISREVSVMDPLPAPVSS